MATRKTPGKKPAPPVRGGTPLDARQKLVAEQEAKLRAQMDKYQQLIENAPRLAKERAKAQREQFVTRAARTEQTGRPRAAAPSRRYELNAGAPAKERRLRAERNQGRMMFFVLLLVFAGVVAWLYITVLH